MERHQRCYRKGETYEVPCRAAEYQVRQACRKVVAVAGLVDLREG